MSFITQRLFRLQTIFALSLGALLLVGLVSVAQAQDTQSESEEVAPLEEVTVYGVRSSILRSREAKRAADGIQDSISAEDIGDFADDNIAEALQRVTGIQMGRDDDGEGATVQIRGISDNNVHFDGQAVAGSGAGREIRLQDMPSELFSGIDVIKTPNASAIEGSLGGTINLKMRKPLAPWPKQDFVMSTNVNFKRAEIVGENDPNINAFMLKRWRDTNVGDFGLILNAGTRTINTIFEATGGGNWPQAPADYRRFDGSEVEKSGGQNRSLYRTGWSPWEYDANIDVNGDGVSDANDVFYMRTGANNSLYHRDSTRDTFNAALQWQPNDRTNIYLEGTFTDALDEKENQGFKYNWGSLPLLSGNNVFEHVADTKEFGPVYHMVAGRAGKGDVIRSGSVSVNEYESTQVMFGADFQVSDRFFLEFQGTKSTGYGSLIDHGTLTMRLDSNQNGQKDRDHFNQGTVADNHAIVDFDFAGNLLPTITFYESPFWSTGGWRGQRFDTELTVADPTDPNFGLWGYNSLNRNSQFTDNETDSLKLDGTIEFDSDGFFQNVNFGVRDASRSFVRNNFQNQNNRDLAWLPTTLGVEGEDPRTEISVMRIPVNPADATDPDVAAASEYLASCYASFGSPTLLNNLGGSVPSEFTANACGGNEIASAFGLHDIRAIDPNTGRGYYLREELYYDAAEDSFAVYLMSDFRKRFTNTELYGNLGVRYVRTTTSPSGWVQDTGGSWSLEDYPNEYSDYLPSLNLNFAISDDKILRFGWSRSLGRAGLSQVAPGMAIFWNIWANPGYAGTATRGNPDIEPVHSNNLDLSFEWYYGDSGLLSLAYFRKDIDSTIRLDVENPFPVDIGVSCSNDPTPEDGCPFLTSEWKNLPGTTYDGYEISLQHNFDSLPGFLKNMGTILNYTIISEDPDQVDQEGDPIPRVGLSENSYNATLYYDNGKFSIRAAYNWRDDFVKRQAVSLGWASPETLPEYEEARGQLDLTARYTFSPDLKLSFSAINLNESETYRYLKYQELMNYYTFTGIRYELGIQYRF